MEFGSNIGGNIITSEFTNKWGSYTGPWQIKRGYKIPTVFDATSYFNQFWDDVTSDIQYLEQVHNASDVSSYLTHFANNSRFIWGSVRSGGLAVCKLFNTTGLSFVLWSGEFRKDNQVRYPALWGGISGWSNINIGKTHNCFVLENFINDGDICIMYASEEDGRFQKTNGTAMYSAGDYVISVSYSAPFPEDVGSCFCTEFFEQVDPNIHTSLVAYRPKWGFYSFGQAYPATPTREIEGWTAVGTWYGGEDNLNNDVNSEGGNTTIGGGNGGFDYNSDEVPLADADEFTVDAINTGFITIYNPTQQEMQDFNDFLFTGITESVSTVLKRLISSPLDYVVSLSMVHCPLSVSENKEDIKFCGISSGVMANRVLHQWTDIDCGTITVNEQFASFLDYGGYNKVKIYVPYCGIYPLNIDDIMGGVLHGKYIIDLLTGNCIFQLHVKRDKRSYGDEDNLNSVLYEFTGNCISSLPISATDWRGLFQGACQVAAGVGAIANGNPVSGVASVASGVMSMKPDVVKSGNLSTGFGYMGTQKPYLIFETPIQAQPEKFSSYMGYTSNIYTQLRDIKKGYFEVSDSTVWTNNIKCTDVEMEEIKTLLYKGVYVE